MARDDGSAPIADRFDLEAVIKGLAQDLEALRAGTITKDDARVRADLAKQIMNGIRLVVTARKYLQEAAKLIGADTGTGNSPDL